MRRVGRGLEGVGFDGVLFGVCVATAYVYQELELGLRIFEGNHNSRRSVLV